MRKIRTEELQNVNVSNVELKRIDNAVDDSYLLNHIIFENAELFDRGSRDRKCPLKIGNAPFYKYVQKDDNEKVYASILFFNMVNEEYEYQIELITKEKALDVNSYYTFLRDVFMDLCNTYDIRKIRINDLKNARSCVYDIAPGNIDEFVKTLICQEVF
ncbi:MAG: hypothetical protein IJT89_11790 [Bacteroidaceae bacterium]|nr:hypothetical protein [Bacteroidaceae bacterium]MBQ4461921.1 hypothetical protein [Bacteroidaceae bacterium]MBQ7484720.1 hypothetical protein [Bacteroidaceae bacterium]